MKKRMIWNDICQNRMLSAATIFFMAISALLLALATLLSASLLGSVNGLMEQAQVPDLLQMHAGELDEAAIARFAGSQPAVDQWQISRFLNLDNSQVSLNGHSLLDSTQDNGLCIQNERFDYLLGLDGSHPEAAPGEVYVPVCYRSRYNLYPGDRMQIGAETLVIAGFLRDGQMNSMMASSKRFLVSRQDYERLRPAGEEEYLVEFMLKDSSATDAVSAAYADQRLPADGPLITRPLIRLMNALADGTTVFVIFLAAGAVLLVSLLCIRFILSIRMERDKREIGMLKALGTGKREIRKLYFAKYWLFSFVGALLGLAAALWLKAPLEQQIKELYGISGDSMPTAAALGAVFLVEIFLLLFVWRGLKKIDQLSVLETLFPFHDARQREHRYWLIGLVTAVCAFLILLPQNLYSTLSSPDFVSWMGIGQADLRLDVRQGEDTEQTTNRIALALEQDERVERWSVLTTQSIPAVLADGTTSNLMAEAGDHTIFPVEYLKGTAPVHEDEIALSSLNAQELGLSAGDTLPLKLKQEVRIFTVCGIYPDITNGGKTAKIRYSADEVPEIWSVLYVSLKNPAVMAGWKTDYSQQGADVTAIEEYLQNTYGPTLRQLRLASAGAALLAILVGFVVLFLFLRLIVEQNRDAISLQKALGFASADISRTYRLKSLLFASAGLGAGLIFSIWPGESLCGLALKYFGADSFRFTVSWEYLLLVIPAVILGTAGVAVFGGTAGIRHIKAYECCMRRE